VAEPAVRVPVVPAAVSVPAEPMVSGVAASAEAVLQSATATAVGPAWVPHAPAVGAIAASSPST